MVLNKYPQMQDPPDVNINNNINKDTRSSLPLRPYASDKNKVIKIALNMS